MNPIPKPDAKRKRGVALSASGLRRLNQAIQVAEGEENAGKRFTAEELSGRTGISTSTLSRLWAAKSGVDRRTLDLLFNALKLDLLDGDIQQETDDTLEALPPTWINSAPMMSQIPYPSGPVPVDSTRYIRRPEVDDRAFQEILLPGCVIRIKAPSGFGKTSLLLRLLEHANQLEYATALIDLQQADTETLADPHGFFRWFCTMLSLKLQLDSDLDQYWDDLLGNKLSTTLYVREAILPQLHRPLVLVINEVERIFECSFTAKNLLPLLRSWHEEAQHDDVWKRLRLVVAYSTDAYLPLDINQSPFNVGLPLSLPEFNREQVQKLAELYSVTWSDADCDRLLALIGGGPCLVGLALYHLYQGMTLDELLQSACTLKGIYRNCLQRLVTQVNANPQWVIASAGEDKLVKLWSLNGKLIQTFTGHRNFVWDVAFSPDGRSLASASWDNTVILWRLDGSKIRTLNNPMPSDQGENRLVSVVFSPDSQIVAGDWRGNMVWWKIDGTLLHTASEHRSAIISLVFSPDGQTLASDSWDNTIKFWNTDTVTRTLNAHASGTWEVAFSHDGQTLISGGEDKLVRLWRLHPDLVTVLRGHRASVWDVAIAPNGQTIVSSSSDSTIKLWNRDGKRLQTLNPEQGEVWAVDVSPDSQTIAAASNDGFLTLWTINGKRLRTIKAHEDAVFDIAFSPNGAEIASVSWDGTVKLWRQDGKLIQSLEKSSDRLNAVAFSLDNQWLAAVGRDKFVRLWHRDESGRFTT